MAQTKYKDDCPHCNGRGFKILYTDFRGARIPDWKNPVNCESCKGWGSKLKKKSIPTMTQQNNGIKEITGAFANDPEAGWMDKEIEGTPQKNFDFNTIFFVYQKLGKIECLPFEQAKEKTDILADDGWEHVATINAVEYIRHHYQNEDAQERYNAAITWLENNGSVYYDSNSNKMAVYLEENKEVQQALKIAAGLPIEK